MRLYFLTSLRTQWLIMVLVFGIHFKAFLHVKRHLNWNFSRKLSLSSNSFTRRYCVYYVTHTVHQEKVSNRQEQCYGRLSSVHVSAKYYNKNSTKGSYYLDYNIYMRSFPIRIYIYSYSRPILIGLMHSCVNFFALRCILPKQLGLLEYQLLKLIESTANRMNRIVHKLIKTVSSKFISSYPIF